MAEAIAEKPKSVPLGNYAPWDASDQKEWLKSDLDNIEGGKLKLAEAIRSLVVAACQRESLGRRLEISQAWRLQLMDRGFHRLIPTGKGGWEIYGGNQRQNWDIYGAGAAASLYDVNVIGTHNDIIVNALNRDKCKTEFSGREDTDEASAAAAEANKLRTIIADDAGYAKKQREAARLYCTDERVAFRMRPVADAQRFGFEDDTPDAVPENEDDLPETKPTKRPRIVTLLDVHGKLEHKCRIVDDDDEGSPYQIIASEYDTASARAMMPWIAEKIVGGTAGIAEIELDRVARQSIKLAIQGGQVTGQGNINDVTILRGWISPKFYYDDSIEKAQREWLLEEFPKGFLAVYAAENLGFVRNEAWQETIKVTHARTGKGQNRRALTEAYAGPNMILDNLFDLIVKFFTSTVPRVFYDSKVFNVSQLRSSGNVPGKKEPFMADQVTPNVAPILQDPMPTHQPALPDFIRWLEGPLAQELTGAQLTLQGAQVEGEQGTLGEAELDNQSAMSRMAEPWAGLCEGFSFATKAAVEWNARVQPEGKVFDRMTKDEGRIRVEMANINAEMLTTTETNGEFPESWTEREERIWQLIQEMPQNPYLMQVLSDPSNSRIIQDAARMGLTIPGAASWEKQEGEFAILLNGKPEPNPQIAQIEKKIAILKAKTEEGVALVQQEQQAGQAPHPQAVNMLEQVMQMVAQLTQQLEQIHQSMPLVSSVPVRGDGSEEDAVEAQCCLRRMISPEGRRLASSKQPDDIAAFQNLHLHWFQHNQSADQQAKLKGKPLEPKASLTLDVSKLPPQEQAAVLQQYGIPANPANFEQMGPHEVTHEVEGVNAQGAKEKVTTSLVGKSL